MILKALQSFLASKGVKELIFGDTYELIDYHRK